MEVQAKFTVSVNQSEGFKSMREHGNPDDIVIEADFGPRNFPRTQGAIIRGDVEISILWESNWEDNSMQPLTYLELPRMMAEQGYRLATNRELVGLGIQHAKNGFCVDTWT